MVSLVAALLAGVFTWISAKKLTGGGDTPLAGPPSERPTLRRRKNGQRSHRDNFQVWLSQAGAAVTPGQFWAVSVGVGVIAFVVLLAISGTFVVSALPAAALAATPYAYWSGQRRKQAAARSAAWPDALRYLVGVLGAGVATLHDALVELARSGPEPLRPPISRYVRMSARTSETAKPSRPCGRTWRTRFRTRCSSPSRGRWRKGRTRSCVSSPTSVLK